MSRILWLVTALLMAGRTATGQRLVSSGFERDINRYRWTGDVQWAEQVGVWSLDLSNRFLSDAFILFKNQLSFRDENRLRIRAVRPLGRARLGFYGNAGWFSLSRVTSQDLLAGLRFTGPSGLWVEPLIGASLDRRPGFSDGGDIDPLRTDSGPTAGIRLGLPELSVDDYLIALDGEGLYQRLEPRRGKVLRLTGSARRTFEHTRFRSSVRLASVRRDAYHTASFLNRSDQLGRTGETIESTRSDTVAATIEIERPFASGFSLGGRLDLGSNRRLVRTLRAPESTIFFDSDFKRNVVEAEFNSAYIRDQVLVRLAIRMGAEVERRTLANEADLPAAQATQKLNLLRQADYDRGSASARLDMRLPLGRSMILQSVFSANILHHDTPLVNPDDRDEVFYNGVVGVSRRLSPTLELQVQALGSWYHTVYLKATRSAENNVQRSLRFRPGFRWKPDASTRMEMTSEVRATYTVDDFLLPGRRPTDQSARELRYEWDAERQFGDGTRLSISGSWSELRLGRFLDKVFAEIPFDTLQTTSVWIRLHTGRKVQAEIGFKTFIRSDFSRAVTVRYPLQGGSPAGSVPEGSTGGGSSLAGSSPEGSLQDQAAITRPGRERILQNGPTMAIIWPLGDGAFLRVNGWATFQRINASLYGDLPEELESVIRRAAKRGRRELIPNLSVSMQWSF